LLTSFGAGGLTSQYVQTSARWKQAASHSASFSRPTWSIFAVGVDTQ